MRRLASKTTFYGMQQSVISRNPEVMGGTPVFTGTRVPVQTLLDYLEAGESIDDFIAGFPSVSRDQVLEYLYVAGPAAGRDLI